MYYSMSQIFKFINIIHATLLVHFLISITAQNPQPNSHITIQGSVFCDVCYKSAFTRHSYFLSGVNVQIECKMKANSAGTSEQIFFSVNRTTNKYGIYKLDIKPFEGADCAERPEIIQSFCKASLSRTSNSSSKCNVPSLSATTTQLTLKSKQNNLCIYSMSPLSYTPHKKNVSLCGNSTNLANSFNSSKFFLPPFGYGYVFNWPPLPQLPPLPSLPPWPPFLPFPFYFPPYPPSQFPSPPPITFPRSPSLPYTYPTPPMPFFPFPPPPSPPAYNPRDPSTWIPNYPPQQPGYNVGNDPRSWMPYYYPPSPPTIPQNP